MSREILNYGFTSKPLAECAAQMEAINALTAKPAAPTKAPANSYGLSEAELAMCERLGITPEAFARTKKETEKQRALRE